MEHDITRWTAQKKAALDMEISQGTTTTAQGRLSFDIASWKIKEQYERQNKDLQEAYGEVMLELRARKCKLQRSQGRCPSWPPEGSTKQIACWRLASTIKSTESRQSVCYITGQIYLLPTLVWGA